MSDRRRPAALGWILLIIGVLLLLSYWYPISFNWMTLLIVLGIGLFIVGTLQRDHGAIFPGTFLFLLGLLFYLREHTLIHTPWWHLWPLIILSLGVAFVMLYIFDPARKGALFPGLFLIVLAFVFLFFPWSWYEILYWIGKLWPVILIFLGLHLILKSVRREKVES